MKLLMITGLGSIRDLVSDKKGAFYYTLEEFHQYWDRIDIISPRVAGSESGVKNIFGNVYVHVSPWPLLFHPFWFLKKGLEIYREQKFNLMTVHEFPPFYNGIGAWFLWNFIRVPYVLEIFHIPGYPRSTGFKELMYKNSAKIYYRLDSISAIGVRVMNYEVAGFLRRYGVRKNKIIIIPAIYIDLDIFKPLNIPKEYDFIFIGRLESNKGLDLLLKAVSNVKLQMPNVKCLIVGEGSLKDYLSLEINHLSLSGNVKLHGYAKDMAEIAELINMSRILVMPSYNEGGPRVVVEAMACGVPALATPVGIVPDLLKNDLGGEIIGWDAEDIVNKAKALLNDSVRYRKYSQSGLEISRQFERKNAIKNYAEQLKFIISNFQI